MTTNFFERALASGPEVKICIGNQQFSTDECIRLLQNICMRKNGAGIEVLYNNVLENAKKKLPKSASNGLSDILQPLFIKLLKFLRTLISMEEQKPHAHVNWSAMETSLNVFEQQVETLFTEYATTIWFLRPVLLPILQSSLADPRTKTSLALAFTQKSLKPVLYQMLLNEYEEFGIANIPISQAEESWQDVNATELRVVIEKIFIAEFQRPTVENNSLSYVRDLAYVQFLKDHATFFVENKDQWNKYQLADLDNKELGSLAQRVFHGCSEVLDQRSTLQLLAILNQIYCNVSGAYLNDKDLAAILLAFSQSKIELQWQLDVHQVSPAALLLYISVLCMRGNIVHIEQAARILNLQDATRHHQQFLAILGIIYTEYQRPQIDKIGVFHCPTPKSDAKTYYFGSQIMQLSEQSPVNLYLAQTLIEIKRQILQPFDAWYAVLHDDRNVKILHQYREDLLEMVEQMWVLHVKSNGPYTHLKQIDHMIARFQHRDLPRIWRTSEDKLVTLNLISNSSNITAKRVNLLQKNSVEIYRNLKSRHHARHAHSVSAIRLPEDLDKYSLSASLHYDQSYWSDDERSHCVQMYLNRQMVKLHRLCPNVEKTSNPIDQLKIFIKHFSEQVQFAAISIELNSAIQIGVITYHCVESILPWANEDNTKAMIDTLSAVTHFTARKTLANSVLTKLSWITDSNSFYYQWFASKTIKNASRAVYEAAQTLVSAPENVDALQFFLLSLLEQQHKLAQDWHFPWHWFWRYPNTQNIIQETLQQVRKMMVLQQIPAQQLQMAEEAFHCKLILEKLQKEIKNKNIAPTQKPEWRKVLMTIETLQKSYSGYAMLYEIQAFLETQEQKFILKQHSYFFGTSYSDQTDSLIKILDTGLKQHMDVQSLVANPIYLRQKAQQILSQEQGFSDVTILPGFCNTHYFDMWITSSEPIDDFHAEKENLWHKRFYHAKDLLKFSHACLVLPENNELRMSFG